MTSPEYTDFTGHMLDQSAEQTERQSNALVRQTRALLAECTNTNNRQIGRHVNTVIKAFENDPKLVIHHLMVLWGTAMNELSETQTEGAK